MPLLSVSVLAIFEFIGTSELLMVLFVALLVFGPRKLPELGRSLGQALNQLRAASDDFKQTWEVEALQEGGARDRRALAANRARRARERHARAMPDGTPPSEGQEVGSVPGDAAGAAVPPLDALPAEANG